MPEKRTDRGPDDLRTRGVQLSEAQWGEVDAEARERQISGSAVLRDAVRAYFATKRQKEALAAA